MKKDVPLGLNTNNTGGAKIPSNNEWNQLNDAFAFGHIGNADISFDEAGLNIPPGAAFNPHEGIIDEENRNNMIIGIDRDDDWYPAFDYINIECPRYNVILFPDGLNYKCDVIDFVRDETYQIRFLSAGEHEPEIPDDVITDHTLVRYQIPWKWQVKKVQKITEGLNVTVGAWPGELEGELTGAGKDYIPDEEQIPITSIVNSELSVSGEISDFDPVNIFDLVEDAVSGTITNTGLYDSFNTNDVSGYINIGAAYFDNSNNNYIENWTQLLLENPGSAVGGGTGNPSQYIDRHPFKGYVSGSFTPETPLSARLYDQIIIGPDRESDAYEFKDTFQVMDGLTDLAEAITHPSPETIDNIDGDSYIYYELSKLDSGVGWTDELKKTDIWPPSSTEDEGRILVNVGYAQYDAASGGIWNWGQHLRSCPTFNPITPRGSFEGEYRESKIHIEAGSVFYYGSDADGDSVTAKAFPLSGDTDIWVQLTSFYLSDQAPSVSVNSTLQEGSYPGFVKQESTVTNINWRIGTIEDGEYDPYHTGDIQIPNTLLNPIIESYYQGSAQDSINILGIDNTDLTEVGSASNDVLLDWGLFEQHMQLGSFERMDFISGGNFYGLTHEEATYDTIAIEHTPDVELKLTPYSLKYESEKGLDQTFDWVSGTTTTISLSSEDIYVKATSSDTTPGYLEDKLKTNPSTVVYTAGIQNLGNNEHMVLDVDYQYSLESVDSVASPGNREALQLVNDQLTVPAGTNPGDGYYYGTTYNSGVGPGGLGYHPLPTLSSPSLSGLDVKVKCTSADTDSGYLYSKLYAGDAIGLSVKNPGGNEQVEIDVLYGGSIELSGNALTFVNDEEEPTDHFIYGTDTNGDKGWIAGHQVLVNALDETPGYLSPKINVNGTPLETSVVAEKLVIDLLYKNSIEKDSADDNIQLVNDEDAPGADTFYGCDSSSSSGKGWKDFTQITVVTDVRLNGLNLEKKTRTAYVYAPESESGWSTVTGWTGTECPSGA
jgi:hypothetical protein